MSGVSCADQTPSFEKTWGSSASSGYCSEEDSDSEFEQYFTARTSFFRKPPSKKEKVSAIKTCTQYTAEVVFYSGFCTLSNCYKSCPGCRNIKSNISL